MSIARPDGSYDWVVANHVLEHLRAPDMAMRELARIVGSGVICLTVPDPLTTLRTTEWGRELQNGHYRQYGSDFLQVAANYAESLNGLQVAVLDPVTLANEAVFFFSRKLAQLEDLIMIFNPDMPCALLTQR